jgi:hypothetical protein
MWALKEASLFLTLLIDETRELGAPLDGHERPKDDQQKLDGGCACR